MKKIRDYVKLIISILFGWLYFPHIIVYLFKNRSLINSDMERYAEKLSLKLNNLLRLIYLLHNNWAFRTLFYHRIGPIASMLIGWWRPEDRYFNISRTTHIDSGAFFVHPRSTGINAKSIGKNFSCRQLTTLGNKRDGDNENRPIIGDNVSLGANVTIIGNIRIGNNVIVGAGSVVVKDVPDNCIVAGNPAKVIRYRDIL